MVLPRELIKQQIFRLLTRAAMAMYLSSNTSSLAFICKLAQMQWVIPLFLVVSHINGITTLLDKISSDKMFDGQNFRHQAEISTLLSDFCLTFVLKHWTKFSTDKIFDTKSKFRQFCPTNFCPIRYVNLPFLVYLHKQVWMWEGLSGMMRREDLILVQLSDHSIVCLAS